jgi:hypothetical protein
VREKGAEQGVAYIASSPQRSVSNMLVMSCLHIVREGCTTLRVSALMAVNIRGLGLQEMAVLAEVGRRRRMEAALPGRQGEGEVTCGPVDGRQGGAVCD